MSKQIIILHLANFSLQRLLEIFHLRVTDTASFLVSRILLSLLADRNNAVVWMVAILHLIFNSFSYLSNTLGTVSSTPTIVVIIIEIVTWSQVIMHKLLVLKIITRIYNFLYVIISYLKTFLLKTWLISGLDKLNNIWHGKRNYLILK